MIRSRTKKILESVKRPATGIVATTTASSGQEPRGIFRMKDGRPPVFRSLAYWIVVPPEGAAVSLPAAPTELVVCQIVLVVFVKKWRVPVVGVSGSAHA